MNTDIGPILTQITGLGISDIGLIYLFLITNHLVNVYKYSYLLGLT